MMKAKPNWPLLVRRLHAYFSVFIAPSLLFFAITGSLQIYRLHEAHDAYRPAPIIERLAAVHKDQVYEQPHHRPPPAAKREEPHKDPPPALGVQALKAFFAVVAAGLVLTTLLGLWMALRYTRRTWTCCGLFAAGMVVPLLTFLLA